MTSQSRNLVQISNFDDHVEQYSAATHGDNYVAVAHTLDGEIYVFIYYYGVWIDRFLVSDGGSHSSTNPDIAYEASSGLFVVVWQKYHVSELWGVNAVAVDPLNRTVGSIIEVVPVSDRDETNPSIACNYMDSSCLVAFSSHGEDDYIGGQFIGVSPDEGLSLISEFDFPISTLFNEFDPHVAWGGNCRLTL